MRRRRLAVAHRARALVVLGGGRARSRELVGGREGREAIGAGERGEAEVATSGSTASGRARWLLRNGQCFGSRLGAKALAELTSSPGRLARRPDLLPTQLTGSLKLLPARSAHGQSVALSLKQTSHAFLFARPVDEQEERAALGPPRQTRPRRVPHFQLQVHGRVPLAKGCLDARRRDKALILQLVEKGRSRTYSEALCRRAHVHFCERRLDGSASRRRAERRERKKERARTVSPAVLGLLREVDERLGEVGRVDAL